MNNYECSKCAGHDVESHSLHCTKNRSLIPNELPRKKSRKIEFSIYLILAVVLGFGAALLFVNAEISPQWVTDQTLDNQTQNAFDYGFQQGIYYTAGYTGETGNFTIIQNDTIQTIPLENYCYAWVQNINKQQEVK